MTMYMKFIIFIVFVAKENETPLYELLLAIFTLLLM